MSVSPEKGKKPHTVKKTSRTAGYIIIVCVFLLIVNFTLGYSLSAGSPSSRHGAYSPAIQA